MSVSIARGDSSTTISYTPGVYSLAPIYPDGICVITMSGGGGGGTGGGVRIVASTTSFTPSGKGGCGAGLLRFFVPSAWLSGATLTVGAGGAGGDGNYQASITFDRPTALVYGTAGSSGESTTLTTSAGFTVSASGGAYSGTTTANTVSGLTGFSTSEFTHINTTGGAGGATPSSEVNNSGSSATMVGSPKGTMNSVYAGNSGGGSGSTVVGSGSSGGASGSGFVYAAPGAAVYTQTVSSASYTVSDAPDGLSNYHFGGSGGAGGGGIRQSTSQPNGSASYVAGRGGDGGLGAGGGGGGGCHIWRPSSGTIQATGGRGGDGGNGFAIITHLMYLPHSI